MRILFTDLFRCASVIRALAAALIFRRLRIGSGVGGGLGATAGYQLAKFCNMDVKATTVALKNIIRAFCFGRPTEERRWPSLRRCHRSARSENASRPALLLPA